MHAIFNAHTKQCIKIFLCIVNASITNTYITNANMINSLYLALYFFYTFYQTTRKYLRNKKQIVHQKMCTMEVQVIQMK